MSEVSTRSANVPGQPKALPRPDQAAAVEAVLRQFRAGERRVQLIAAPGVGKTLMALWTLEGLQAELSLAFAPTLALLSQTARVWLAEADPSVSWDALCVCSDDTIAEDLPPTDSLVPVTTDPAAVARFLRGPTAPAERRVLFSTYQSLAAVEAALAASKVTPALLVADEAHRLAGAEGKRFQAVLDASRVPAHHRLFLTATPRLVPPRRERRDALDGVVSMDDPALFGIVAARTSFGQAISLGLLADYRLEVLVVQDPSVGRLIVNADPYLLAAAQAGALAGAIGEGRFRRVFTLHHTLRSARRFVAAFDTVADGRRAAGWTADCIAGTDSIAQRLDALSRLFAAPAGMLASVRTLIEGIDVPSLDAVCFVDPKQSVIEIAQGIGRALRRDPARPDKMAHIIVPVIVRDPARADEELQGSAWEPVWRVLAAMAANDERLAEVLALAQEGRARSDARPKDSYGPMIPPNLMLSLATALRLVLPPTVPVARLRSAIAVRALEELGDPFDYGLGRLKEYVERIGSAHVPTTHLEPDGFPLGAWSAAQRSAYRKGSLANDHIARLEGVAGWTWARDDATWLDGVRQLRSFTRTYGHARVPTTYRTRRGYWLGEWAADRRAEYWRGELPPARQARLQELPGWTWGCRPTPRPRLSLPSSVEQPTGLLDREFVEYARVCPELERPAPPRECLIQLVPEEWGPWQRRPIHPICDWLVRSLLPQLLRRANLSAPAAHLEESEELLVRSDINRADWRLGRTTEAIQNRTARVLFHATHIAWSLSPELNRSKQFEKVADRRLWNKQWSALVRDHPSAGVVADVQQCVRDIAFLLVLQPFTRRIRADTQWAAIQHLIAESRRSPAWRTESQYGIAEHLLRMHFCSPELRERRLGTRSRTNAYYILTGTVEAQERVAADRAVHRVLRRIGQIPWRRHAWREQFDEKIPRKETRGRPPVDHGPRDQTRIVLARWRATVLEPLYTALQLNREPSHRSWRREYRGIQWTDKPEIRLDLVEADTLEGRRGKEMVRILRAPRSLALGARRAATLRGLNLLVPRSTLLAAVPLRVSPSAGDIRRFRAMWVQDSTPYRDRVVVVGWIDVREGAVCGVKVEVAALDASEPRFGPAPKKKAGREEPSSSPEASYLAPRPGTIVSALPPAWWPNRPAPWAGEPGLVEPLGRPTWVPQGPDSVAVRPAPTSAPPPLRVAKSKPPRQSSDRWYFLDRNGKPHGPIVARELKQRLRYAPDLQVRHETHREWASAQDFSHWERSERPPQS